MLSIYAAASWPDAAVPCRPLLASLVVVESAAPAEITPLGGAPLRPDLIAAKRDRTAQSSSADPAGTTATTRELRCATDVLLDGDGRPRYAASASGLAARPAGDHAAGRPSAQSVGSSQAGGREAVPFRFASPRSSSARLAFPTRSATCSVATVPAAPHVMDPPGRRPLPARASMTSGWCCGWCPPVRVGTP
jgi:hypothetical protein